MTVKEVLNMAAQLLNIDSELSGLINQEVMSSESKKLVSLFNSAVMAHEELALDYFPLLKREEIIVENNKLYYADLSKEVKDIYSIDGIDGKSFTFKAFPDYCHVFGNGNMTITYSYVPAKIDFGGKIENFCGKVSCKMMALLVASEYCYMQTMYEEAKMWRERFEDCIKNNMSKKSNIIMPKRAWL